MLDRQDYQKLTKEQRNDFTSTLVETLRQIRSICNEAIHHVDFLIAMDENAELQGRPPQPWIDEALVFVPEFAREQITAALAGVSVEELRRMCDKADCLPGFAELANDPDMVVLP